MTRPAIAATAITMLLTGGVAAGIGGDIFPHRVMPVLLAAWGTAAVITVMLWTARHVLGNMQAVRDLSSIVARDLTRSGAASRQGASSRQVR